MDPIITIRNLYKRYGPKTVLKGIDLDIYPGQIIGYIGPNGAGKSTTVKILCGLINDYEGEIFVKGMDLKENPVKEKALSDIYLNWQSYMKYSLLQNSSFLLANCIRCLPM